MAFKTQLSSEMGKQNGVALIVTMVIMLMVAVIAFSAMAGSVVELKLASAAEVRTLTFQSAESAINRVTESVNNLGQPIKGATPRTMDLRFKVDANKTMDVNTVAWFRSDAAAPGYSIRRGAAGLQIYHYEVSATSAMTANTAIATRLAEGVMVEAPRIN